MADHGAVGVEGRVEQLESRTQGDGREQSWSASLQNPDCSGPGAPGPDPAPGSG